MKPGQPGFFAGKRTSVIMMAARRRQNRTVKNAPSLPDKANGLQNPSLGFTGHLAYPPG
jgi:hypothetical protein